MSSFSPSKAPGAMMIVECDVPADMTLAEWRRCRRQERPGKRRRARLSTLLRLPRRQ